jgi:hypothetical protein
MNIFLKGKRRKRNRSHGRKNGITILLPMMMMQLLTLYQLQLLRTMLLLHLLMQLLR